MYNNVFLHRACTISFSGSSMFWFSGSWIFWFSGPYVYNLVFTMVQLQSGFVSYMYDSLLTKIKQN